MERMRRDAMEAALIRIVQAAKERWKSKVCARMLMSYVKTHSVRLQEKIEALARA